MQKPFIYLVKNTEDFIKKCNTGWGNGYVAIPKGHPLEQLYAKEPKDGWGDYLELCHSKFNVFDFYEEITYTEYRNICGADFLVVGFDTAHRHNNIQEHNFEYVVNATHKMLDIVNYSEKVLNK